MTNWACVIFTFLDYRKNFSELKITYVALINHVLYTKKREWRLACYGKHIIDRDIAHGIITVIVMAWRQTVQIQTNIIVVVVISRVDNHAILGHPLNPLGLVTAVCLRPGYIDCFGNWIEGHIQRYVVVYQVDICYTFSFHIVDISIFCGMTCRNAHQITYSKSVKVLAQCSQRFKTLKLWTWNTTMTIALYHGRALPVLQVYSWSNR